MKLEGANITLYTHLLEEHTNVKNTYLNTILSMKINLRSRHKCEVLS